MKDLNSFKEQNERLRSESARHSRSRKFSNENRPSEDHPDFKTLRLDRSGGVPLSERGVSSNAYDGTTKLEYKYENLRGENERLMTQRIEAERKLVHSEQDKQKLEQELRELRNSHEEITASLSSNNMIFKGQETRIEMMEKERSGLENEKDSILSQLMKVKHDRKQLIFQMEDQTARFEKFVDKVHTSREITQGKTISQRKAYGQAAFLKFVKNNRIKQLRSGFRMMCQAASFNCQKRLKIVLVGAVLRRRALTGLKHSFTKWNFITETRKRQCLHHGEAVELLHMKSLRIFAFSQWRRKYNQRKLFKSQALTLYHTLDFISQNRPARASVYKAYLLIKHILSRTKDQRGALRNLILTNKKWKTKRALTRWVYCVNQLKITGLFGHIENENANNMSLWRSVGWVKTVQKLSDKHVLASKMTAFKALQDCLRRQNYVSRISHAVNKRVEKEDTEVLSRCFLGWKVFYINNRYNRTVDILNIETPKRKQLEVNFEFSRNQLSNSLHKMLFKKFKHFGLQNMKRYIQHWSTLCRSLSLRQKVVRKLLTRRGRNIKQQAFRYLERNRHNLQSRSYQQITTDQEVQLEMIQDQIQDLEIEAERLERMRQHQQKHFAKLLASRYTKGHLRIPLATWRAFTHRETSLVQRVERLSKVRNEKEMRRFLDLLRAQTHSTGRLQIRTGYVHQFQGIKEQTSMSSTFRNWRAFVYRRKLIQELLIKLSRSKEKRQVMHFLSQWRTTCHSLIKIELQLSQKEMELDRAKTEARLLSVYENIKSQKFSLQFHYFKSVVLRSQRWQIEALRKGFTGWKISIENQDQIQRTLRRMTRILSRNILKPCYLQWVSGSNDQVLLGKRIESHHFGNTHEQEQKESDEDPQVRLSTAEKQVFTLNTQVTDISMTLSQRENDVQTYRNKIAVLALSKLNRVFNQVHQSDLSKIFRRFTGYDRQEKQSCECFGRLLPRGLVRPALHRWRQVTHSCRKIQMAVWRLQAQISSRSNNHDGASWLKKGASSSNLLHRALQRWKICQSYGRGLESKEEISRRRRDAILTKSLQSVGLRTLNSSWRVWGRYVSTTQNASKSLTKLLKCWRRVTIRNNLRKWNSTTEIFKRVKKMKLLNLFRRQADVFKVATLGEVRPNSIMTLKEVAKFYRRGSFHQSLQMYPNKFTLTKAFAMWSVAIKSCNRLEFLVNKYGNLNFQRELQWGFSCWRSSVPKQTKPDSINNLSRKELQRSVKREVLRSSSLAQRLRGATKVRLTQSKALQRAACFLLRSRVGHQKRSAMYQWAQVALIYLRRDELQWREKETSSLKRQLKSVHSQSTTLKTENTKLREAMDARDDQKEPQDVAQLLQALSTEKSNLSENLNERAGSIRQLLEENSKLTSKIGNIEKELHEIAEMRHLEAQRRYYDDHYQEELGDDQDSEEYEVEDGGGEYLEDHSHDQEEEEGRTSATK
eukprot:CAMPEP_0114987094 /NCGR_PEP_ID=MMETSP0216-20121206/8809_1 /TAXON_ID=223996 /ORGANISM="Protocruzia adherens, Strain Boccale" /LENGTH=1444 /DNA_ID=CAMNT_0002349639 /DNA_START=696 /DNA_END=5030 /DNA_ORIENTATION=-